jgi:hypothetical protein
MMKEPSLGDARIYWAIVGLSALLCLAWMMTGSFWLTMAVMLLGGLHLARYFPYAEAFIADDPLLVWTRRISPLIILGIFGIAMLGQMVR